MYRLIKIAIFVFAVMGCKLNAEEVIDQEMDEPSSEQLEKIISKLDELSKRLDIDVEECESLAEEAE